MKEKNLRINAVVNGFCYGTIVGTMIILPPEAVMFAAPLWVASALAPTKWVLEDIREIRRRQYQKAKSMN